MSAGEPRMPQGEFVAVVVAAGRSLRFGGATAKQFVDLAGSSVLDRAIAAVAYRPGVRGAVIVLPPAESAGALGDELRGRDGILDVVAGGRTRADSVGAGVAAAGDVPFVLVHDAARPLASAGLVDSVIATTRLHGAAVPGLEVPDTVKRIEFATGDAQHLGWVAQTVDRAKLRLAQTPQGARTDWLLRALERAAGEKIAFTDEAAALEHDGRRVAVVAGDPRNRKITSALDLEEVRAGLGGGIDSLRVGHGFDIHRFGADRPLVLGGVVFEGPAGLEGHSDADVVLHAVMDALLGAAGLGDIGRWFPPDDPRYAGADSVELTRQVARRIAAAGYAVINLDITVLAERPRILGQVERMRAAIAGALELAADRIGLKATTLERLGALGRGEGIACQTVALLRLTGKR